MLYLIAKLYFYKIVYISVSRFVNALHKRHMLRAKCILTPWYLEYLITTLPRDRRDRPKDLIIM